MSIEVAFDNVSIALKNFWQACLMDEDGRPLNWTQPLITSINTPRLKLLVAPTEGGSMKAYTGYELPENISLTMYETANKDVEKYLDSWMFGPKGVFNRDTGKFRSRDRNSVTNIYRCIKFSTFLWRNADPEGGDPAGAKLKSPDIEETLADVVRKEPEIRELLARVMQEENRDFYMETLISTQQVAAQLTSLVSGAANQLLGHIPAMAVGRVIIPPPLIKEPLASPLAAFKTQSQVIDSIKKVQTQEHGQEESVDSIKLRKTLEQGDEQDISSIKKFKHEEKITSTTVYTCAIEGYDVAAYDYESGGPVSYTVNLSVLNYIKPEYS